MNNDITSLRELLFETMREVKAGKMDLDRAKVVSELSQVIINSAKAETDALRVIGGSGSGFVPALLAGSGQPENEFPSNPAITRPAPGVTRHRLL